MNKILTIVKREFVTRIKTKSFIAFTIIAPLVFVVPLIFLMIWQVTMSPQNKVLIIDEGSVFANKENKFIFNELVFEKWPYSLEKAKDSIAVNESILGIIYTPDKDFKNIQYIVDKVLTEPKKYSTIQNFINQTRLKHQFKELNIPLASNIHRTVKPEVIILKPKEYGLKIVAMSLAYVLGMVMYLMLITYTNSLLKGVIEEKQNRIVEVIGMVVKPYQLMLGKIIGIGMVGFIQLFLVIFLSSALFICLKEVCINYIGIDLNATGSGEHSFYSLETIIANYRLLPTIKILVFIPLFFISGFLLNGAITAALGATTNDEGDNAIAFLGNFMNIFAIYFAMIAVSMPNSAFAKVSMYIPFLAPIVTPSIIPFDIPLQDIIISLTLIILTFIGIAFFAGKIYKASMLTYGTKIRIKDIKKMIQH